MTQNTQIQEIFIFLLVNTLQIYTYELICENLRILCHLRSFIDSLYLSKYAL